MGGKEGRLHCAPICNAYRQLTRGLLGQSSEDLKRIGPVPKLCSVSRSRLVRIRFESLLRGFQSLNIVLPWNLIEVVISCDCVESRYELKPDLTAKNQRWINYAVDRLRTSPITGITLSYLSRRLRHSNQDLSLFDLSQSSSFPRAPASSIYFLSLDFPRFSLAFATSLDFPALSVFPALSGFPALSVDYVASLEFPRFCRSARSSLDPPRLRSPASFKLELHYYRVLLRHSIESIWIKLISSLVLKK